MMQRLLAVGEITVRRLMKSRLLLIGVIGSLLIIGLFMSSVLGMVKLAASGQAVSDVMVIHMVGTVTGVLGWLAQLIGIFVGVTVVKRDILDGTVAAILSKPVSRGEYIAASYGGSAAYLLLMWVLFAIVLTLFAAAFKTLLNGTIYGVMLAHYLVCVVTMAIALFFSIRLHPWVAVLLTFVVLRARATIEGIANLVNALGGHIPDGVVSVLTFPFPVFDLLGRLGERIGQGSLAGPSSVVAGFLHVIDYGLVMAVLAWLVFRHLEINRVRD